MAWSLPAFLVKRKESVPIIVAALLSLVLILLSRTGFFPLQDIDFYFLSVILFLVALCRPAWVFLGLLIVLPVETISLMPQGLGMELRPYQWSAAILGLAILVRVISGRTSLSLFRLTYADTLLLLVPLGAFLSGFVGGGQGLRLALIVLSFAFITFLARVFFRTENDVRIGVLTFFSSGLVVAVYAIVQNVLFLLGHNPQTVMEGRPNATMAEPDWLGLFLVFLIGIALFILEEQLTKGEKEDRSIVQSALFPWMALLILCTALTLTVSRSAWLAALALTMIWYATAWWYQTNENILRRTLWSGQLLSIAWVIAILLVVTLPLTRFDLINRAGSTATGLQKITIACVGERALPDRVETVEVLSQYGCRHINLEDIKRYEVNGYFVTMIERPDPNVAIRSHIYERAIIAVKDHPFVGIGWGNIGERLGTDGRGATLNASNLWLELWLGAGLLGVLGLFFFFLSRLRILLPRAIDASSSLRQRLLLSLLAAFLVFNLFNAGILIGFVWVWFALLARATDSREKSETVSAV